MKLRNKRGRYSSLEQLLTRRLGLIVILSVFWLHAHDSNRPYEAQLEAARLEVLAINNKLSTLEHEAALASNTLDDVEIWEARIKSAKLVNLYDFFHRYAPSSDNNNPNQYAETVARNMGIDPSQPAVETLHNRIPEFAQQIAAHEGFYSKASLVAVENKNPGNLRYVGQKNAVRGRSGFARFHTVSDGWSALHRQIARDLVRERVATHRVQ